MNDGTGGCDRDQPEVSERDVAFAQRAIGRSADTFEKGDKPARRLRCRGRFVIAFLLDGLEQRSIA